MKAGDNLAHFEIECHVIARGYVIKKNFMCCEQFFNFCAMSHIFHMDGKDVEMRKCALVERKRQIQNS